MRSFVLRVRLHYPSADLQSVLLPLECRQHVSVEQICRVG